MEGRDGYARLQPRGDRVVPEARRTAAISVGRRGGCNPESETASTAWSWDGESIVLCTQFLVPWAFETLLRFDQLPGSVLGSTEKSRK